jgi:hypothetical protein
MDKAEEARWDLATKERFGFELRTKCSSFYLLFILHRISIKQVVKAS